MAIPRQRRHPVRAQPARLRPRLFVVEHHHPSFAGRDVLVREEAEAAGVAQPSTREPVELDPSACAASSITIRPWRAKHVDGPHIDRKTTVMDDNNSLRSRRDKTLDLVRVDREVVERRRIREANGRAGLNHRGRRRNEGEGRTDDLVPRADSERHRGEVERGRAVCNRDCGATTEERAKSASNCSVTGPMLSQPPRSTASTAARSRSSSTTSASVIRHGVHQPVRNNSSRMPSNCSRACS